MRSTNPDRPTVAEARQVAKAFQRALDAENAQAIADAGPRDQYGVPLRRTAAGSPSLRTLGAHVVATGANDLFRLTCREPACSGWWTTATSLGEAVLAAEAHDADHARWADQDARR